MFRFALFVGILFLGVVALLASAEKDADEKAVEKAKKESAENLRKIAAAIHAFHDDYKQLPHPYAVGKDKKPLLSWRVDLLPYLGEKELYAKFKLEEPWDSEHNKKLLARIPKVFAPVLGGRKDDPVTFYQVFTTLKESKLHSPFSHGDGLGAVTLSAIANTDGTSLSMMVAEAGTPVEWTRPLDMDFDSDKKLPQLGGLKGFHAAMCDGAVHWFKKDVDAKTLRKLVSYNDGEVVDVPGENVRK